MSSTVSAPPPPPPPPFATVGSTADEERLKIARETTRKYYIQLPLPFLEYVNTFGYMSPDQQWGDRVFDAMWDIFHKIYKERCKHYWRVSHYIDIGMSYFIPPLEFSQHHAAGSAEEDGSAGCNYRFPTIWLALPDGTLWIVCIHILMNGYGGRPWQVHAAAGRPQDRARYRRNHRNWPLLHLHHVQHQRLRSPSRLRP